MRNALSAFAAVVIMLFPVLSQAQQVMAESGSSRLLININLWRADYEGTILMEDTYRYMNTAVIMGKTVDMEEFGLDSPQYLFQINADLKLNRHLLSVSYFYADYSGQGYLEDDIPLAGYVLLGNSQIDSTYKINHFKLIHSYSLLWLESGSLGIMWGVNFYNLHVGYTGTELTTGLSVKNYDKFNMPFPVLGFDGKINLPYNVSLHGQLSGFKYTIENVEIAYADMDAELRWVYGNLQIGLGYRLLYTYLRVEINREITEIDIVHHGIYMSAGYGVDF